MGELSSLKENVTLSFFENVTSQTHARSNAYAAKALDNGHTCIHWNFSEGIIRPFTARREARLDVWGPIVKMTVE